MDQKCDIEITGEPVKFGIDQDDMYSIGHGFYCKRCPIEYKIMAEKNEAYRKKL